MTLRSNLLKAAAFGVASFAFAGAAFAAPGTTQTSPLFPVTGNVPTLCSLGTISGSGAFPLGVLIDTTTGKARTNLSAPDQTITGSWCNTPSTISISATQLAAVNSTATPPAGFSRTLNYTATAAGWSGSATPATFTVGAASNPNATRTVATAITAPIVVSVSNIVPVGTDPFLVADTSYLGNVTVTIAVQAAALPAS